MARFYINKEQISEGKVIIQGKDVNHIKNVLRMKVQDSLELCDNENTLYNGRIAGFHPNFIEVFIDTVSENQTEPDIKLTVLQCIPKGDKMIIVFSSGIGVYSSRLGTTVMPSIKENGLKYSFHEFQFSSLTIFTRT
jgi:16S rRNA (uracil1498-N3)-methyltransferase